MIEKQTLRFEPQKAPVRAIALDVGSHRVRTLRRDGLRLLARSQRACYVVLPFDSATEEALRSRGMAFTVCEEGIVVLGDAAAAIPTDFGRPVIAAMPDGRVPIDDVLSRQVLALLIEAILPAGDGMSVCMVATPSDDDVTEEFFAGLVQLRGHVPILMNSTIAGGLTSLSEHRLTGVSIDIGASHCRASVVAAGREIVSDQIPRGGRWLDDAFFRSAEHIITDANGEQFRDDEAARQSRERCSGDLSRRARERYTQLSAEITTMVIEAFEAASVERVFRRPTPISLFGGLQHDPALVQTLHETLMRADLAQYFATSFVTGADDLVVPRGLLMAAEIEADAMTRKAA